MQHSTDMAPGRHARRIPWAMRVLNLYGGVGAQVGWTLLGVGLLACWIALAYGHTIAVTVSAVIAAGGAILALRAIVEGRRTNALLARGTLAWGTLIMVRPVGIEINKWPVLKLTYRFTDTAGTAREATSTADCMTWQVIMQLADVLAARLAGRAGSNTAGHPTLPGANETSQTGQETCRTTSETDAVSPAPLSGAVLQIADDLLEHLHTVLSARLPDDHPLGRIGAGLVRRVTRYAGSVLRAYVHPLGEPIFYDPRHPECSVTGTDLPYNFCVDEQERLRGGSLPQALLVLPLPWVVVLGHGIYVYLHFVR